MALIFPTDRTAYQGKITFQVVDEQQAQGQELTSGQSGNLFLGNNGVIPVHGETCTLYLPPGLQFSDNAVYDNVDLGIIGAAVEKAGLGALGADDPSGQSYIDGLSSSVGADTPYGRVLAGIVASKMGGAIGGGITSANRVTLNPNTRALFRSVPLREFAFTFKLIPVNEEEAKNIKEIIKYFRTELYPEKIPGGTTGISVGYKFPNRFYIRVDYNGTEIGTKFLPSYLKNFIATYNPSNMTFFKSDGEYYPSEIDVTMTFMEAKALSRIDVDEGGY